MPPLVKVHRGSLDHSVLDGTFSSPTSFPCKMYSSWLLVIPLSSTPLYDSMRRWQNFACQDKFHTREDGACSTKWTVCWWLQASQQPQEKQVIPPLPAPPIPGGVSIEFRRICSCHPFLIFSFRSLRLSTAKPHVFSSLGKATCETSRQVQRT